MKFVQAEKENKPPQPESTESTESVLSSVGAGLRGSQEAREGGSTEYRDMIGSLMYALTGTSPDIAFAAHLAARHVENPTREDFNAHASVSFITLVPLVILALLLEVRTVVETLKAL